MDVWMKAGLLYLVILNIAGFISMGIDKAKAKKHAWRIPEKTLFLIAILGGSLGSILGMQVFRHKTKHKSFMIGMPVIFLVEAGLLATLFYHFRYKETTHTDFAMGTVVTQTIYGRDSKQAVNGVQQCLIALETGEVSWRSEASAVSAMNEKLAQGQSVPLSPREQLWLGRSLQLCKDSGGALDVTLHPIIELWGIETEQPRVPAEEEIREALNDIGYEGLQLSDDGILSAGNPNLSIDLGSVGKGIAADEVRSYLETQRIAGGVVSIGGTILVYGEKPGNQDWQIGIRDPRGDQSAVLGTLTMEEDGVISTSGDYEKYFIEDGIRYHHIFDRTTGTPAKSGLMSVTVVCDSGLYSDGLSTACFVLGYEKSLSLLQKYQAEAIFVTDQGEVYVTDGLADAFTLTNENYRYGE